MNTVSNYVEKSFKDDKVGKISTLHSLNLQKQEIIKKIEAKIEESSIYRGLTEFDFCQQQGFLEGLNEAIKIIKQ